jgi:hypothetical protein
MNNNKYNNVTHNLIRKQENKCYNDYGFISKIYEITNKNIDIKDYHRLITEDEHIKILNNMPYKKFQDKLKLLEK